MLGLSLHPAASAGACRSASLLATFDGACKGNPGSTGQGSVLFDCEGAPLRERLGSAGETTNNVSEYKALCNTLELALEEAGEGANLLILGDSSLCVMQVCGQWNVTTDHLLPYRRRCHELMQKFDHIALCHVKREFNAYADAVANDSVSTSEVATHDRDPTLPLERLALPEDVRRTWEAQLSV